MAQSRCIAGVEHGHRLRGIGAATALHGAKGERVLCHVGQDALGGRSRQDRPAGVSKEKGPPKRAFPKLVSR